MDNHLKQLLIIGGINPYNIISEYIITRCQYDFSQNLLRASTVDLSSLGRNINRDLYLEEIEILQNDYYYKLKELLLNTLEKVIKSKIAGKDDIKLENEEELYMYQRIQNDLPKFLGVQKTAVITKLDAYETYGLHYKEELYVESNLGGYYRLKDITGRTREVDASHLKIQPITFTKEWEDKWLTFITNNK